MPTLDLVVLEFWRRRAWTDLALAYVLIRSWISRCVAEVRGMSRSPESVGDNLERERGRDLVADLVGNLVANSVDI